MAWSAKIVLIGAALVATAAAGCGSSQTVKDPNVPATIKIGAPFNGELPAKYTCDGTADPLQFNLSGVPPKAKALAFTVSDPDAPGGTFYHWVMFNIDPKTNVINGATSGPAINGRNSAGDNGYS